MLSQATLQPEVARLAASLPPFPKVVARLLDMLADEETSMEQLVGSARNDPIISSGILATANRLRRVQAQADLHDVFVAASLIGVDRVRRIVVGAGMNKFLADERGAAFLFEHSRAVAICAQELSMLSGISPEKTYVAAILHDVGQLAFHVMDATGFEAIYRQSAVDGRLIEREREVFGVDHAEVGAALARHWDLPEDFATAIRAHHDSVGATEKLSAIINVAESLSRALDIPPSPKNRVTRLNAEAVEALGIVWNGPEMLDCFGRCRARFRQRH